MPNVNAKILRWARKTAGLSPEDAVEKLDLRDARGVSALERLAALESGDSEPTRPMLVKMAKQYRRPLLTFYMSGPPRKGDRGEDFRTLSKDHSPSADVLLDTLIRDIRARQSMVRAVIEDEDEAQTLDFIGSKETSDEVSNVVKSIRETIRFNLAEFRAPNSAEDGFALLRKKTEAVGIFVLLIGNLGSHHTAIDLETFRGFALADPVAPFVIINDQDSKAAWSFTLLHELVHLWLGQTGVSGAQAERRLERFCNDVAGELLLPTDELVNLNVRDSTNFESSVARISEFAGERNLSRSMVAYKLYRSGAIEQNTWSRLSSTFRQYWLRDRAARRERSHETEGGPSYYVVRRHRVGTALIDFVRNMTATGALTTSKAGKVLGVKPKNVQELINPSMLNNVGPA